MFDLRSILSSPIFYQGYQRFGGFHSAKLKALRHYLPIAEGSRIVDIGCGPGHMTEFLPDTVEYFGFDVDAKYIAFAQEKFGQNHRFFCRMFDDIAAAEVGSADVVMMNGVLHHLDDATAVKTIKTARSVLKPDGRLIALDGCYCEGQSRWAKLLLDWDRGGFVRTEKGYRELGEQALMKIETHIRSDLSLFPYTFSIMIGTLELA